MNPHPQPALAAARQAAATTDRPLRHGPSQRLRRADLTAGCGSRKSQWPQRPPRPCCRRKPSLLGTFGQSPWPPTTSRHNRIWPAQQRRAAAPTAGRGHRQPRPSPPPTSAHAATMRLPSPPPRKHRCPPHPDTGTSPPRPTTTRTRPPDSAPTTVKPSAATTPPPWPRPAHQKASSNQRSMSSAARTLPPSSPTADPTAGSPSGRCGRPNHRPANTNCVRRHSAANRVNGRQRVPRRRHRPCRGGGVTQVVQPGGGRGGGTGWEGGGAQAGTTSPQTGPRHRRGGRRLWRGEKGAGTVGGGDGAGGGESRWERRGDSVAAG